MKYGAFVKTIEQNKGVEFVSRMTRFMNSILGTTTKRVINVTKIVLAHSIYRKSGDH